MSVPYANGFQARMASGKRQAQAARNRGLSGGKQGWTVYRASAEAPVDQGSYEHLVAVTEARWRSARADCVEAFLFQVYGDQWEGFV